MKNLFITKTAGLILGVFILCNIAATQTFAQSKNTYTLKGKVIDQHGDPATLVTVTLLTKSKRVIAGTLTDITGNYEFKLSKSNYEYISYEFLGFENQVIESHKFTSTLQMYSVGEKKSPSKSTSNFNLSYSK